MALDAVIRRKRPSWCQQFLESPYPTIAKTLYARRQRLIDAQAPSLRTEQSSVTVVCISDTHNSQPTLPLGDLLIHAGDMTQNGSPEELQAQLDWLNAQPHLHKVVIAGNHDVILDQSISPAQNRRSLRWGTVAYLECSAVSLNFPNGRSLKIFGHPSTRRYGNWAFQYDKGTDSFTHQVSDDVDILVTHSPPRFHLDEAGWGDGFLLRELWRVKPRLHVFGHVHAGYGRETLIYDRFERLYERICAGSSGILAILEMVLSLFWTSRDAHRSVLVNASAVGGLQDQHRRTPQVVHL